MFEWFKRRKEGKEPVKKITVNGDLDYVIRNSKHGEEVKGIDSTKLALVSVRKQNDKIAVSIEFERDMGSDIFTEVHRTIVNNADEAVFFFTRFGINGQLSWIGDCARRYHKKTVSLAKN